MRPKPAPAPLRILLFEKTSKELRKLAWGCAIVRACWNTRAAMRSGAGGFTDQYLSIASQFARRLRAGAALRSTPAQGRLPRVRRALCLCGTRPLLAPG